MCSQHLEPEEADGTLHLAGWQSLAAGMGWWDASGKHFGQVKLTRAPVRAVSPDVNPMPGHACPERSCTGIFSAWAPGVVLPWAQVCSVTAQGLALPAVCVGQCEPCAPEPARMHLHSRPSGSFAPVSSQWTAEATPSMPHQALFRGHHHLLGTMRLPWHSEIASVSL